MSSGKSHFFSYWITHWKTVLKFYIKTRYGNYIVEVQFTHLPVPFRRNVLNRFGFKMFLWCKLTSKMNEKKNSKCYGAENTCSFENIIYFFLCSVEQNVHNFIEINYFAESYGKHKLFIHLTRFFAAIFSRYRSF